MPACGKLAFLFVIQRSRRWRLRCCSRRGLGGGWGAGRGRWWRWRSWLRAPSTLRVGGRGDDGDELAEEVAFGAQVGGPLGGTAVFVVFARVDDAGADAGYFELGVLELDGDVVFGRFVQQGEDVALEETGAALDADAALRFGIGSF